MEKKRNWRVIFTWLLFVLAAAYAVPSFIGEENVPSAYPFKKAIRGGLDLAGGLELRYEVVWEKAIEDAVVKVSDAIRMRVTEELAKKANENPADLTPEKRQAYGRRVQHEVRDTNVVRVTFADQEAYDLFDSAMLELIDERYELSGAEGLSYDVILPDKFVSETKNNIVNETRDDIERRVGGMGLLDPDVRIAGESDIHVQIPGLKKEEMDLVRQHLGRTAQLTFRMVDRKQPYFFTEQQVQAFKAKHPTKSDSIEFIPAGRFATGSSVRASSKTELVRFVRDLDVPSDHMIGFQLEEVPDPEGGVKERFFRTQYIHSRVWLTGGHLSRASATYNEKNQPVVTLRMNSEGAEIFAKVSGENVNEHMAIMLDDDVVSDPYFVQKITGGRAEITMGGAGSRGARLGEARALAKVLENGAYKAPVYKVQDQEVSASLGSDQVDAGMTALILGFLLVVAFMIVYYRASGVIAVIVLGFNMLLILMLLVSFNSALTLPGIAGIILTIGMAVDANIIVFERIREELLAGRSPRAAVDTGYAKALSAILDANITTALAGFILLNYTSGTIQNFAVTLLMGVVCSVFTAVVVARMIFNYWLTSRKPTVLSI